MIVDTVLEPHFRGDTFRYGFTLGNNWDGSMLTGGVVFTLRRRLPKNGFDDSDEDVVDQASIAGGEILFAGADGFITIPASRARRWPAVELVWDLQGIVAGSPNQVFTVDRGTIEIAADVTLSQ